MISSSETPIVAGQLARPWGSGRAPGSAPRCADVIDSRSSCSRRGTRIAQPRSRKCRLISPTIVGVAYVENSTPALGVEAVDRLDQADRADLERGRRRARRG